jgi:putative spermidine/putrescine transport system permease protein
VAAPIVVIAGVSLNARRQLYFPPRGLSFQWYVEMFTQPTGRAPSSTV